MSPRPGSSTGWSSTFGWIRWRTRVVSRLAMRPNPKSPKPGGPIVLDGEALTFGSASLDGAPLKPEQISFEDGKLTLADIPSREVKIEISSTCNPQGNSELSGLYLTNGIYCTQCEAEGFRRITYFYDRPDVMTRYTVRMEANKASCPVLLLQRKFPGGRRHRRERTGTSPSGMIRIRNRATSSPLLPASLAGVHDSFTTMSGGKIRATRHLCGEGQGEPLRLGDGVAQDRDAVGRKSLRARIRPRCFQHRRGLGFQHGGDGKQGAQCIQRQIHPRLS